MNNRRPPQLDMTLDGEFVAPRRPPIASRVLFWAVVIAAVTSALSLAAFALWIALMVLPVALGAAAVAWLVWRYRAWQAQRTMGAQRGVWRP